jgi:chlorinating enzyme
MDPGVSLPATDIDRRPAPGLSDAQQARFATDGYLAPLDALTGADAAALCRRLEAVLTPSSGLADARLRNKPHLVFAWVAALVSHPRILDAVEALLGPDLLVLRSVFFVKPPRDPGYVAWHQDSAYWDLSDDRSVTAWIALTASTIENGCVHVVSGSHRGPLLDHRLARDPHNRLLRGQVATGDIPTDRITAIELQPGQFSLHDVRLLHSSPPNPSAALRAGLAVRYIPPDVRSAGPRQTALLVRGEDRYGFYDPEPLVRTDYDSRGLAAQARGLRAYALHSIGQILRRPTLGHLALLARMAMRPELLRAMIPLRGAKRDP